MTRWTQRPAFELSSILGVVTYMLTRSDVSRFDLARALLDEDFGSVHERDLMLAMEDHYSREVKRIVAEQNDARRANREYTRKTQGKDIHDRRVKEAREFVMRRLFALPPEELLDMQGKWKAKHPNISNLMREKPKGLGVNAD